MGGYDSNLFYSSDVFAPVSDGFVELSPDAALTIGLAPGLTLGAEYSATLSAWLDTGNEVAFSQALEIPVRYWVTPWLRLEAAVGGDHYTSPLFPDDVSVGASAEAAAAASWGSGEVLVGYGAHFRTWLSRDPEQHDLTHLPRIQALQAVHHRVSLLLGYQYAPKASDQPGYDLAGHRLLAGTALRLPADVTVRDFYLLYARSFAGSDATEILHSNRLEVGWQANDWLEVGGRWDASINRAGPAERDFAAHSVAMGVSVRWGAGSGVDLRQIDLNLPGLVTPPSSMVPRPVEGGVQFRLSAPAAHSVALVADFNGWDGTVSPMAQDPATGVWRVVVSLEPGSYEYAFLVDDEIRVPPEASHYVESGFGDRNAVVIVE